VVGSDGRAKAYRPLGAARRRAAREAGIAAFEAGGFWHAHELLEPAWMGSADPAERDLDQGLIKLAAAYVHAQRGNATGMRKNLVGASRRLGAVLTRHGEAGRRAAVLARVDVPALSARVEAVLGGLEQPAGGGAERAWAPTTPVDLLARFPPPSIPRVSPAAPPEAPRARRTGSGRGRG
jgi:predicted metal-dependent hydrolase